MSKTEKSKNLISLIINLIIASAAIISMLLYLIPNKFYSGPRFFKYYTNLSNMFLCIGSSAYIYINILRIKNNKLIINKTITLLKFYSTITTTITFLVVLFFLGPIYGFKLLFGNPQNVMFHGVSPVLGIISFLFLDQNETIEFKHTLYAFSFTVLYAVFYAIYIFTTGDDFYGFNKNGVGILILTTVLIFGTNFGLACLYRFISNKLNKKQTIYQ